MPRKIEGKMLTQKEHRMWKHVYDSMIRQGVGRERAAAAATTQVKKARKK